MRKTQDHVIDTKKDVKRLQKRGRTDSTLDPSKRVSETYVTQDPIERLCKLLLNWRVLDDIVGLNEMKISTIDYMLPTRFESFGAYVQKWQPLSIEEIKASVLSNLPLSTADKDSPVLISVAPFKDGEFESSLLKMNFYPAADSENNRNVKEEWKLALNMMDLVLLSTVPVPRPLCRSGLAGVEPPPKCLIGLVTAGRQGSTRGANGTLTVFGQLWNQFDVPMVTDKKTGTAMRSAPLHCLVLDNLIPVLREFSAIVKIERCLLGRAVLSSAVPVVHPSAVSKQPNSDIGADEISAVKRPKELSALYSKWLAKQFNGSQLSAIKKASSQAPFTLIQGPPGTGKTATVIGILNTLHVQAYNRFYDMTLDTCLGPQGVRCRNAKTDEAWIALVDSMAAYTPHILVTAPSNVAVDNIVQRLMEKGFVDGNGAQYHPMILRLGAGKGSQVKVVSLEDTMDSLFASEEAMLAEGEKAAEEQRAALVRQALHFQMLLMNLKTAFQIHPLPLGWELRVMQNGQPYWVDHNTQSTTPLPPAAPFSTGATGAGGPERTLDNLPEYMYNAHKLVNVMKGLAQCSLQARRYAMLKAPNYSRQSLEHTVIEEAHIVLTTLNGAGHPSLDSSRFPVVVVDEAAQAVEPSTLIPLRLGCGSCVLVGDPMQLPATVFSSKLRESGYSRSLFERLASLKDVELVMLDTQYRMAPVISAFPAKMFYEGRLQNGPNVTSPDYLPKYLTAESCGDHKGCLRPLLFFDLQSSRDRLGSSQSRVNTPEAEFCVKLLECLLRQAAAGSGATASIGSVGVITPYQDQLQELRRLFLAAGLLRSGASNRASEATTTDRLDIELNTVDAFQGREKDIVIISCVRAGDSGGIGFLSDKRRLNVAITRARHALYLVGRASTLCDNSLWSNLLAHFDASDALVEIANVPSDVAAVLDTHWNGEEPAETPSLQESLSAYMAGSGKDRSSESRTSVHRSADSEVEEGEEPG